MLHTGTGGSMAMAKTQRTEIVRNLVRGLIELSIWPTEVNSIHFGTASSSGTGEAHRST